MVIGVYSARREFSSFILIDQFKSAGEGKSEREK
jgi:hypothetical protein